MIFNENDIIYNEKFSSPINIYLDRDKNKVGIFYVYDNVII
ncbi:MAG: hypothetical protein N2169_02080 [bacterium]|nr:hypothetical protein [bacterium]